MEGEETPQLLETLSARVEASWEETDDDRRMFLRGLRHLQKGEVRAASRVFRRAVRRCEPPFCVMARMARGRCEVVRDRQGVALRTFRRVAESDAPDGLRKMAWMEIADLARERGDEQMLAEARDAMSTARRATPAG